jgi:starch synthase
MSSGPLNVVMFAAEAFPFVKVGGLADVVGALPRMLEKLGATPVIVIPAYQDIQHARFGIRPFDPVPWFDIPMGPRVERAEIFHTSLPDTGIDVFLIGCHDYFSRDGIYDNPVSGEGFVDNMQRYVFFMKAGLALLQRLRRRMDIIHCHDSQSALIPGFLRTNFRHDPFFASTGSLFTIHNLAYQGIYPKHSLFWAGIDPHHHHLGSPFEFYGQVNFMKVGIECSDMLNTVSASYALEIQSHEHGYGLDGVLRARQKVLHGIVNGIDYEEWNPGTDRHIPARYSPEDLSGKARCKAEVLKRFGLPESGMRVPLIGMVSRLADQKGFELLKQAEAEIASLDFSLVVLGRGQRRYHDLLSHLAALYPEKIAVRADFDDPLAHTIYAGADLLLVPSKYEPCGLNQLIALRYGTVPIVRATGGLVDTVRDYDSQNDAGTGFRFHQYSAQDLTIALRRALEVYANPPSWRRLIQRDMLEDWSWEESGRRYMELYRSIYRQKQEEQGNIG